MWSTEDIRKNYRNFDDSKIIELAKNPSGLRKDVIPILKEEIRKRNLDIEIIECIDNETNFFEGLERQNLIRKIIKSKCTICSINSDLKGYRFNTLISALFVITDKTEELIICHQCAKSKRFKSMLTTFFLGWWSKRGFLATPFNLISDTIKIFRTKSENKIVIDKFIDNNTGILRISLQKEIDLNSILREFNKQKNNC